MPGLLFNNSCRVADRMLEAEHKMVLAIDSYDEAAFTRTPTDALVSYFVGEFGAEVPVLDEAAATLDHAEAGFVQGGRPRIGIAQNSVRAVRPLRGRRGVLQNPAVEVQNQCALGENSEAGWPTRDQLLHTILGGAAAEAGAGE